MSEEKMNNEETQEESLKQEWAGVGKGVGKTFATLGKSLIKTAKVGVDVANDWVDGKESDNSGQKSEMKQEWKKFGHSFVDTAQDLGKTGEKTIQKGFESDGTTKEGNEGADGSATETDAEAKTD